MTFSKFLKIMHCYFGQEKSQYDFMYLLFSMVVSEPFSEDDMEKDEGDEYYPFSKLCEKSIAKKVYNGERVLPKALARFVHSHFDPSCFNNKIEDMSDEVKGNLCNDFVTEGIMSNLDDVSRVSTDLFDRFISLALEERDTVDTWIKSESMIQVQSSEATNREVLLLEETSCTCPICGSSLLRSKKGNVVKRYKVVKIFPDNLDRIQFSVFNEAFPILGNYDSDENLITLCTDCALDYESEVSFDEFNKLLGIKGFLSQQRKMRHNLEIIEY